MATHSPLVEAHHQRVPSSSPDLPWRIPAMKDMHYYHSTLRDIWPLKAIPDVFFL